MSTDSNKKLGVPIKSMTLVEFADIAKLVLDEGLEEFCTTESLKEIHEDSDYREYSVILNTNRINTACRKVQRMKAMFKLTGINLGSRDLLMKRYNYDITRVTGQRLLLLRTDAPKIVDATVWGHGPGDRGEKVPIPFWADCQLMAVKTEFDREDGSQDTGTQIEYLEGSTPINRAHLYELLGQRALTSDMLEQSMQYQPLVLRGKIGTFTKLTKWRTKINPANGKPVMEEAKDKRGAPIRLPDGSPKLVEVRERDDEGFPCIQGRIDNPEEEIYTFAVTVGTMDRSIDTKHNVKVKFLNKKVAKHLIELHSQQRMFRDAFAKGIGTANDAFDFLTNTYRGTEVLVVGVMTRWDEQSNMTWIDVEGTMLLALNITGEQMEPTSESPLLATPSPQAPEQATLAPEAPAVPTVPSVSSAPVVEEPAVPAPPDPAPTTEAPVDPAPAPAPPMATEEQKPVIERLDAAIHETMEMYGKDKMTFEEFEDFGLCPTEFLGAKNKILKERKNAVEKRIAKLRKDLGTSEVGSYGDTESPTSVSTQTPKEAAATEVESICAACEGPMTPTPHGHWEVCPENPKNKEKADAK